MGPKQDSGLPGRSRAPVDDAEVARIIEREVQEEIIKDPFGEEVTHRFIRMRIMEVEAKRVGAQEDLAALPDETLVDDFLEHHGG